MDDIRLWELGELELYDLKLSVLKGGEAFDVVYPDSDCQYQQTIHRISMIWRRKK
jgi:hypothetical protein